MPKKPGSYINLLYNDNNVNSALLNIIMELKRALRILLETTVNYYKDNIINNNNNTIVDKNVKCKLFHLLMETYQMVNIALWKLLNCIQCLKFENNVELKDTLIYLINQVSNLSKTHQTYLKGAFKRWIMLSTGLHNWLPLTLIHWIVT